jgi:hypothetical protein
MANRRTLQAEVRKLKNTQKTLHRALRLLFELIEEYSPLWYEKRYHDQAKAALTERARSAALGKTDRYTLG